MHVRLTDFGSGRLRYLIGAANPVLRGRADVTVAEALTGVAARIEHKYATLPPGVRGHLHAATQLALSELSRAQDAVPAGRHAVQARVAAAAVALREARLRLALDLVQLSQLDEAAAAMAALQASLVQLEAAAAPVRDLPAATTPARATILSALGDDHPRPNYTRVGPANALARQQRQGDAAAAADLLRPALERARRFLADDAPQVQQIRCALAEALPDLGQPADARPEWPARRGALRRRAGPGSGPAAS